METIEKIKSNYNFTSKDARNLKHLAAIMEKYIDSFPVEFYKRIKGFEDADKFLKDEETIKKHQTAVKDWFSALFSGEYDNRYLMELEQVGAAHVKVNLSAHYVNASMHFVREFCWDILEREIENDKERYYFKGSVDKILDINLDVLTSSYIEEEMKHVFLSQKVESILVKFANRFSYGLNLILVIGLVAMGMMVVGLFIYDVTHILDGNLEKGLLSTLGSLLMLWVVIELVDTEVKHLKGAKFSIKVFVSVALVSIIRKILVTSLKTEEVQAQISLVVAVAVLGGVYWLISKVEK